MKYDSNYVIGEECGNTCYPLNNMSQIVEIKQK